MLNNVVLMGRLTATPELKTTMNGVNVTTFTVAVERQYVRAGEQRQADFINVVAWRGTADFVTRYFEKGSMIAVQGSIQTRKYEDRNGNKRTAFEIVANNVSFCGGKNENNQTAASTTDYEEIANNTQSEYYSNAGPEDFNSLDISDDDELPF